MSNLISYDQLLKSRRDFIRSGKRSGSEFNLTDTPGFKYFKLFFYFQNGDSDDNQTNIVNHGGLLSPSWLDPAFKENTYYQYNSAYSYLVMNDDDARAELLKQFIILLSNISSESPWYFAELGGLDLALERKLTMDSNFKIEEQRQKISIKCLPDAFDDRIGTLLDLYRSITWSWVDKQVVLPANLRKFDMGVFIYETPNVAFHKDAIIGNDNSSQYKSSYKYVEFHNCEIDYSSSKGNLNVFNNTEGLAVEYTIDILFDDCYETRYNEFLLTELGDMIKNDLNPNNETNDTTETRTTESSEKNTQPLIDKLNYTQSIENMASNQLFGTASNIINSTLKRAVLGNLFTFSLTRLNDQINSASEGNVWSTLRGAAEYINDAVLRNTSNYGSSPGNIFPPPKKIRPDVIKMGKMFESSTIASNI